MKGGPESVLVAEFATADGLVAAASRAREIGYRHYDALTPCYVEELDEIVPGRPSRLRAVMLAAGLLFGGAILFMQWYSAAIDYPINSGGRPFASWPAFGFAVFETGVLAASVAGFVTLLITTGLPRLHDPLFDLAVVDRATHDRFLLVLYGSDPMWPRQETRSHFERMDALALHEVER